MHSGLEQRTTGHLPAEVTSFVGREAELARITALLETHRLVTLTGPGGVGKTRVALRAGWRVAARYADGACLAELSALRDPGLLPEALAAVLGLDGQGVRPLDAVLGHLRDRSMLLILDTCEHLIDECAMLSEAIMRKAPGVTLLATSRQPLDAPGESTYFIPPLPTPTADAANGEAVELFAQRAAAAVPGFAVTAGNRKDVIRLCQRLDGIPLAIELAAVRLRALPLHQLANRLDNRFQVLTGGRRGTFDRHQTLHSAIAWSYDLCTPAEQALWARLSVFAGAFDIAAAQEVCAGGELAGEKIIDTIARLVDKSVLIREPAPSNADGTVTRYRLLDTMREFGVEQLTASGDEDQVRSQHAARFLAAARTFRDHLADDDQLERYRELRAGHDDLIAALDYTLGEQPGPRRRSQDGVALAAALEPYWHISGRPGEGKSWLTRAAGQFPGPSGERALALTARARLSTLEGNPGEAVADATEGTEIAVRAGDERLSARGYLCLNLALTSAGRPEEAADAGAEARRRLEALGDRTGLLMLDEQLGYLAICTGDFEAAAEHARRGLHRLGASGERWLRGSLQAAVAIAMLSLPGGEAGCADAIGAALRAAHELGDPAGTALALEVHGWLAARTGRAVRASWLLGAAAPLWEAAGARLARTPALTRFHRQARDAAEAALGGERFAALFGAGERHPLAQVVALARDGADELSAPPPEAPEARPLSVLTNRERQIAALVASGLSNREIGERMVISKRTVDTHVEHIFAKLGLNSRVHLTIWLRDRTG